MNSGSNMYGRNKSLHSSNKRRIPMGGRSSLEQCSDSKYTRCQKYQGLKNEGATCYLNSVLQVFFMTTEFREAVERHHNENPNCLEIDRQLTTLFGTLKSKTADTCLITEKLGIDQVYVQRDAAEYFEMILRMTSPDALQIFQGKLRHVTVCNKCENANTEIGGFLNLPLPLETSYFMNYSVMDGIDAFFSPTNLSGDNQMYCNQCDAKTNATIECQLDTPPEALMLLLKRFEFNYDNLSYIKIDQHVEVSATVQIPGDHVYELYAVVNHFGSLKSGHYTSTIKSQDDDCWYDFNDTHVTQLDSKQVMASLERSRHAYLLAYRKKKMHQLDPATQGELYQEPSSKEPQAETEHCVMGPDPNVQEGTEEQNQDNVVAVCTETHEDITRTEDGEPADAATRFTPQLDQHLQTDEPSQKRSPDIVQHNPDGEDWNRGECTDMGKDDQVVGTVEKKTLDVEVDERVDDTMLRDIKRGLSDDGVQDVSDRQRPEDCKETEDREASSTRNGAESFEPGHEEPSNDLNAEPSSVEQDFTKQAAVGRDEKRTGTDIWTSGQTLDVQFQPPGPWREDSFRHERSQYVGRSDEKCDAEDGTTFLSSLDVKGDVTAGDSISKSNCSLIKVIEEECKENAVKTMEIVGEQLESLKQKTCDTKGLEDSYREDLQEKTEVDNPLQSFTRSCSITAKDEDNIKHHSNERAGVGPCTGTVPGHEKEERSDGASNEVGKQQVEKSPRKRKAKQEVTDTKRTHIEAIMSDDGVGDLTLEPGYSEQIHGGKRNNQLKALRKRLRCLSKKKSQNKRREFCLPFLTCFKNNDHSSD